MVLLSVGKYIAILILFSISLYCDTSFKTKKNTEINFLIKMIEYYFSNTILQNNKGVENSPAQNSAPQPVV